MNEVIRPASEIIAAILDRYEARIENASAFARQHRVLRLDGPKVGRNDPCACGSGKKFKK